MEKRISLIILGLAGILVSMINSCKKDSFVSPSKSFTEEFEDFYELESKGWVIKDNSPSGGAYAPWRQGTFGSDKSGIWYGFSAFSYKTTADEFAYSSVSPAASGSTICSFSSWLITPVLSVKNGDKISFYTRGDTIGTYTNRMQVLMNKSLSDDVGGYAFNSVGNFTTTLFDINSSQTPGSYPTVWTKYEYTFSGLSGKTNTRIAFRHFATNVGDAKGIGIDQFRFQAN